MILLDTPERALCVAPHPDDDTIGCGGTLATFAEAGVDVHVAYVTSGESGNREFPPDVLGPAREAESMAAAGILGISIENLQYLQFPDLGSTARIPGIASDLVSTIERVCPQVIFVPHQADRHPDHRAAHEATRNAIKAVAIKDLEVVTYEVWTPLEDAQYFFDISEVIGRKALAMSQHRTQMAKYDYIGHVTDIARSRAAEFGTSDAIEVFGDLKRDS